LVGDRAVTKPTKNLRTFSSPILLSTLQTNETDALIDIKKPHFTGGKIVIKAIIIALSDTFYDILLHSPQLIEKTTPKTYQQTTGKTAQFLPRKPFQLFFTDVHFL
jgi:hypothetical protein